MTRTGVVLSAVLMALTPVSAKAQASGATPQAEPVPKKAEEVFKNIQTLKGVPAYQIFPAMQFISASLGVQCEYCHVERQFDKDDKEKKKTARKMMEMMFAINKDNFNGRTEVTCNSCHHGTAEPAGIPEIAAGKPMPMPAPAHAEHETPGESHGGAEAGGATPSMPTAQQILAKYTQAVGGEEALNKITSRTEKGTLSGFGPPAPIEIFAKAPNKRISVLHRQNANMFTAFDGQAGWMTGFGGNIQDMEGADAYAARLDADFQLLADAAKVFKQVRVGRPEKVADKDAWVLLGITPGQPPVKLYFDKDSGLLLRQVRYAETPVGRFPTQVDYSDFREADGIKIPYKWTIARPGNSFAIQADEVQQNVPVDDAKFAKPAAPAQQKPPGQ
jgi:photosynthetic reaction center cytochrome c subunit